MPLRNKLKKFVDEGLGITAYQFRKETGLSNRTAYDLYNNPEQIPHVTSIAKICDRYKVQPNEIIEWFEK